jgi:hypothetical protein
MEVQHPPIEPTKRCPSCRQTKPHDAFPKNRSSKDGLAAYCKPCHNRIMKEQKERRYGDEQNYLLKLRYGIDAAEAQLLIEQQGGTCAICRTKPAVHVDHDHATGRVRGILCFACNRGLGKASDSIDVLKAMIAYLREHSQ